MTTPNKNKCILFFVKYPVEGKVKTRLGKSTGKKYATQIYKCFVDDILKTLSHTDADVFICYDPIENMGKYSGWFGSKYTFIRQRGEHLGEKMKNAFEDTFSMGVELAVLIASDIPEISTEIINEAFIKLDVSDAAIGPSADGGYYLIGFSAKSFTEKIFKGIQWSRSTVFSETMKKFEDSNVSVLSVLNDIDTAGGLAEFLARNKDGKLAGSKTLEFIKGNCHV